jgi:LuxR family transcriptional regulator, maltose regulon positive regulatory protein
VSSRRSYDAGVPDPSAGSQPPELGLGLGLDRRVVTPGSKLRPPAVRLGEVRRRRLLAQLSANAAQLVLVLAPAGYGKTTVISQWAADAGRALAWGTVNEADADPVVLMSTVLAALSVANVGVGSPRGVLTADEPAFSRRVLPEFQQSLEQIDRPVTLVIDDVHVMAGVRAAVVLSAVLESLPSGSQLALVGRSRADLPVALWRSQGRVCELGIQELAFDADEVADCLTSTMIERPSANLVAETVAVTRGWPVAVYLQGLAVGLRNTTPTMPSPALDEYLDSVVLAGADVYLVDFLRRSSVLTTLSAAICDDVLGVTSSHASLKAAEQTTQLISRLEGVDGYYRLHPLLRDRMSRELVDTSPGEARALHARAARWYEAHGYTEDAIVHAAHAEDLALYGLLVWAHAPQALIIGRSSTVNRWLAQVDETQILESPALSITAAFSALLRADGAATVRWAEVTASLLGPDWQSHLDRSTVEASLALLVALPGTAGYEGSAALAGGAHQALPVMHPLRALAFLISGSYLVMGGAVGEGRAAIERSRDLAQSMDLGTTWVGAATMLAVLDAQTESWLDADEEIDVARRVWLDHDLDDLSTTAWMSAVSGFLYARGGRRREARADLQRVEMMVAGLGPLLPWLQVLVHSFMSRTWSLLGETSSARRAAALARTALERVPASDFLLGLVVCAERALQRSAVLERLSPAELRLWPLVLGRLTLRDVARELQVSPETVKSELRSIYRKLGVSTRRELQEFADGLGD